MSCPRAAPSGWKFPPFFSCFNLLVIFKSILLCSSCSLSWGLEHRPRSQSAWAQISLRLTSCVTLGKLLPFVPQFPCNSFYSIQMGHMSQSRLGQQINHGTSVASYSESIFFTRARCSTWVFRGLRFSQLLMDSN